MDDRITDTQSPQASASTNSAIRAISRLPDDVSQIIGVESSDGGTHVATPGEAQAGVIAGETAGVATRRPQSMSRYQGGERTQEYRAWLQMRRRCLSPGASNYAFYGGRGITICDRWRESFESFRADVGVRPTGTELDRIDNDGNYEPGNCKWSTKSEQARNRRTTRLNPQAVQEIHGRLEHGERVCSVARRFATSPTLIRWVRDGRIWREFATVQRARDGSPMPCSPAP